MTNKQSLITRPLSEIECFCGCGKFAKVDSKFNSIECGKRYFDIKTRAKRKAQGYPDELVVGQLSKEERRALIISRYGVGVKK